MNPGDTLKGQGQLLQHGRLIVVADYHLTIPSSTHFAINPIGKLKFNVDDHMAGFILIEPRAAEEISSATDYTLELSDKAKLPIRIERRYKQVKHQGQARISFWVTVTWNHQK
jgi:TPP-dependent indolepyruvate ferredoxin oxidoreductase alpha subunit